VFLKDGNDERTCKSMKECMHKTGVLIVIVKDPRVTEEDNETFTNMMERYFEQSQDIKKADARPEVHYQVGVTPEFVEVPRCSQEPDCLRRISEMPEQHRAHPPTGADPKERFFWRMSDPPPKTNFPELNAAPVVPKGFAEWEKVMNVWGTKMIETVTTVAKMLEIGLGLKDEDAFVRRMKYAPHLLAPTGTDFEKYGDLDKIVAGFHYDLNLLTIHGKSRYPGLYVWLRTGEKYLVKVPDGCLLIQGGKQLEILTGGYFQAGEHEVVVGKETQDRIKAVKEHNHQIEKGSITGQKKSLWRISSTLFGHVASDAELRPLAPFDTEENLKKYPPILAGHQVQAELEMIKLAKK